MRHRLLRISVVLVLVFFGREVFALRAPSVREGRVKDVRAVRVVTLKNLKIVESSIVRAPFAFQALAAHWPAGTLDGATLEIRFDDGAWQELSISDDGKLPDEGEDVYTELAFAKSAQKFSFRLIADSLAGLVTDARAIEFIYLTGGEAPRVSWLKRLTGNTTVASTTMVTRSQWGANESLRHTSSGAERWPRTYLKPRAFVLHHTAGSDGGLDPATVIQYIYYSHAMLRDEDGWGDIGYNYLIDPAGVVYEGRFGGDGVVGAHAYNDLLRRNYNYETVGIAFLGTYTTLPVSIAARDAATQLIAEKSQLHGIVPNIAVHFFGDLMATVSGHGDVDQTTCPGQGVRGEYWTIRNNAAAALAAMPVVAPTFVANPATPTVALSLDDGATASLALQFTNGGTQAWTTYDAARRVTLKPVSASRLGNALWLSADAVSRTDWGTILPGETGTFSFPLTAPHDVVDVNETFALFTDEGNEVSGSRVNVAMTVTGLRKAVRIRSIELPPAAFTGGRLSARVTVENVGRETIARREIRLAVYDVDTAPSAFRAASWTQPVGMFRIDQASLAPGATTTLTFNLRAPSSPGLYQHRFALTSVTPGEVATTDRPVLTRVDAATRAASVTSTLRASYRKTWRSRVVVTLKNEGITTWRQDTTVLLVRDVTGRTSPIVDSATTDASGAVTMRERRVRPGGTATFVFRLRPRSTGTFATSMRLLRGRETVTGSTLTATTRIDP